MSVAKHFAANLPPIFLILDETLSAVILVPCMQCMSDPAPPWCHVFKALIVIIGSSVARGWQRGQLPPLFLDLYYQSQASYL